jgi:hypothetical protein
LDRPINICFEYQLRDNDVKFIDDFMSYDEFQKANSLLYDVLDTWSNTFENVDFSYKGIFIPDTMKFQFISNNTLELQLIFLIYTHQIKNINIVISKNYIIKNSLLEILKILKVEYKIIKHDIILELIYKPATTIKKDPFIKKYIRNIISYINNSIKISFSNRNHRTYIQSYHSNLNLMEQLDDGFVSDNFPKKTNLMLDKNKTIYFNPTLLNSSTSKIYDDFSINNEELLEDFLINFIYQYYKNNLEVFYEMIDHITINFKKYNVKNAIINTELVLVNNIVSQVIKRNNGKVYLLNHGIRTYSACHYHGRHKNYDDVFCWSKFETTIYSSLSKHLKCINLGYPHFLLNENKINYKKIVNPSICILPDIHFELWDVNYAKALDSMIILIKYLKENNFCNISIKIHPGVMNKAFFADILSEYIDESKIYMNESINEIISISDILIGPISTAYYDSTFLDTPYLVYVDEKKFSHNIFEFLDIAIYNTTNLDKLISKIGSIDEKEITSIKKKLVYNNSIDEMVNIIKKEIDKEY